MVLLMDVALWLRGNDFDKVKAAETSLKQELFEKNFFQDDADFFDLIGPSPHQLNRNFLAESYVTNEIRDFGKQCVAVK